MRFSLFLLLVICAPSVLPDDNRHAVIFITNNYHLKGEPCEGGNIISIESISRTTDDRNIKDQLNLKYFPAGAYSFVFKYSTLQNEDGACSEKSDDNQLIEITQEVKHYEAGLTNSLDIYVRELDDRPISMNDASGLSKLTYNRSIWFSSCMDLFPNNKTKYANMFKASSFAKYADVFSLTLVERNFLSKDRVDLILRTSAREMKILCDVQNVAAIKSFDYLYGPYVEDVKAFMQKNLAKNNGRGQDKETSVAKTKEVTIAGTGPRTLEEINSTMAKNKNQIFVVYNRKLRRDPNFGGIYYFKISIDENGAVKKCGITGKGGQDTEFAEKVCSRISNFNFGYKKNSGTKTFEYPINFK